jgi:hypothetical protein
MRACCTTFCRCLTVVLGSMPWTCTLDSACATLAHPGACTALELAAVETLGLPWTHFGQPWTALDSLGQPWTALDSLGHSWTCQRGRVRGLSAGLARGLACAGKSVPPTQGLTAAGLAPPVPGTQCRHPGRCMPGSLVWPAPAGSPHAAQLPVEEDRGARQTTSCEPSTRSESPRVGGHSLYGRPDTTSDFADSDFCTIWA